MSLLGYISEMDACLSIVTVGYFKAGKQRYDIDSLRMLHNVDFCIYLSGIESNIHLPRMIERFVMKSLGRIIIPTIMIPRWNI